MVLSWLAGKLFGYALARLSAGDPSVVRALYAPDVELTFPGDHSFGGVFRGKPAVSAWIGRFAAVGLQIAAEQVVAVGPPWGTTVVARIHVWLPDGSGGTTYDTRGVIWGRLRWGRMARYEVFEDTVPAVAFDAWLAEHRPELAGPVAGETFGRP